MRIFFIADIQGSTPAFERFLGGLESYDADVGVVLGDLSGGVLVPLISLGASRWRTAIDDKPLAIESTDELNAARRELEARGHYWVEVTEDEQRETRDNPGVVDLLFKSAVRRRVERWLDIADERLRGSRRLLYMTPGSNDWPVIDDLFDPDRAAKPCDGRIVSLNGYDMITCSATGQDASDAERGVPDGVLQQRLEELFAKTRRPEYAIFNCRAHSRAADKVVKKRKPMLRMGSSAGSSPQASVSHIGTTLAIDPGMATAADGVAGGVRGVMVELEQGSVKDYAFITA